MWTLQLPVLPSRFVVTQLWTLCFNVRDGYKDTPDTFTSDILTDSVLDQRVTYTGLDGVKYHSSKRVELMPSITHITPALSTETLEQYCSTYCRA